MTRSQTFAIVVGLWLLVLGWAVQPHRHAAPRIAHTWLLDHPAGLLPTLPPVPDPSPTLDHSPAP